MTDTAHSQLRDGEIVYVLPWTENGKRVGYRQNPDGFETERVTFDDQEVRAIEEGGREIDLHLTPAWCETTEIAPTP